MPLYEIHCGECGATDTMFRHVDQRNDTPEHCGKQMQRVITAANVRPDIQPYQSPIDGRPVNSRRQRLEDLKRNGCRPWEGLEAEKAHAASCKASEDLKFEAGLAKTASDVLNNLSSEHQNVLKGT